jgi:N6-L-threonylcarbamoyladenine synthase
LDQTNVRTCVIAGGVAANNRLRKKAQGILDGISIHFPYINYCTDNAAMVAYLGERKLHQGQYSSLSFGINPNLQLK